MNVLVLGATGGTGKEIIRSCLEKGFRVTAIARQPDKLAEFEANITIIQGQLTDKTVLTPALENADVVFSGLGPVKGQSDFAITQIYKALLMSMKTSKTKRLISVTGAGVKDPKDGSSLTRSLVRGIMKLVAAKVLQDSEQSFELIKTQI